MSGDEVHFLIRERIAIFEVRRWIAVNYPAPYRYMIALLECAGPAAC